MWSIRSWSGSMKVRFVPLLLIAGLALTTSGRAAGQEQGAAGTDDDEGSLFPTHGFLVTGYGAAGYQARLAGDATPNDFSALLAPVFLFQVSDRFLFEGEVEFELEEGVTATSLEYAQVDFPINDNLTLAAGKMLLPFNVFSERYHPVWINPLVSPPPVYGHHGGAGPTDPLLPVLSDVGAQVRGTFNVGRFGYLTAVGFVSQGPAVEVEEGDAHQEGGEEGGHATEVPEVVFGSNFEDNNEGKMLGGRVGIGVAPYFEVNLSAMTGEYDHEGRLGFTGYGAHVEARHLGFTLHGEWVLTRQDVASEEDPADVDVLDRNGYWLHLGRRIGAWEPQLRWSQILDGDAHGETVVEGGEQLAFGLVYWLDSSVALKGEYLVNFEDPDVDNDRIALQWAFGF